MKYQIATKIIEFCIIHFGKSVFHIDSVPIGKRKNAVIEGCVVVEVTAGVNKRLPYALAFFHILEEV